MKDQTWLKKQPRWQKELEAWAGALILGVIFYEIVSCLYLFAKRF